MIIPIAAPLYMLWLIATGSYRLKRTFTSDHYRPRVCKNASVILKSALLCKICQRSLSQRTYNLRRNTISGLFSSASAGQKRFYTASAISGPSLELRAAFRRLR
jgi:hypothetical protein